MKNAKVVTIQFQSINDDEFFTKKAERSKASMIYPLL